MKRTLFVFTAGRNDVCEYPSLRAMQKFGHADRAGRKVVIFGFGKVGRGGGR